MTYPFDPDWTVHPGDILRDELQCRGPGLHVNTWARILHLTAAELQGIYDGTTPVTPEIAVKLATALGTSDTIWLNLERAFRAGLATGKTWLNDEWYRKQKEEQETQP